MTQFYEVRDSDHQLVWIAARETDSEHRIFVYLPNTRRWHRSTAVEDDYYAPDRTATYTPISAAQAARSTTTLRKLSARTAGWLLNDLKSAATMVPAELEALPVSGRRPTTQKQVLEILDRNDGRQWVKVYNGHTTGAARVFASELRNGRKSRVNRIGRFETRVVQGNIVEARRVDEAAVEATRSSSQHPH